MHKWIPIITLAMAGPASAQIVFDDSSKAKIDKSGDPALEKIVCRYEETVGSRLKGHKVCASVREWQEQREQNQDGVRDLQLRGQQNPTGGG